VKQSKVLERQDKLLSLFTTAQLMGLHKQLFGKTTLPFLGDIRPQPVNTYIDLSAVIGNSTPATPELLDLRLAR
jgi:fido (protein-threonine AMPylation protein)